jgi:hypothetical protein
LVANGAAKQRIEIALAGAGSGKRKAREATNKCNEQLLLHG